MTRYVTASGIVSALTFLARRPRCVVCASRYPERWMELHLRSEHTAAEIRQACKEKP